ncbi:MAG: hypothetical protein H0V93_13490 [Euzebyales bacterium]|nr:hypothetical protein [Euzebyales bacterium]
MTTTGADAKPRSTTTGVAFDYAWWLTGDDDRAAAAVRAALARPADRLAGLLGDVRRAAIDVPSMCPASELALLHDRARLPLPDAAALVALDADEARAELAHGRLEALVETVDTAFAHPERLGGLAVSNPADVAHARTCDSCATARGALRRGRDALGELPARPLPDGLAGAPAPDLPPTGMSDRPPWLRRVAWATTGIVAAGLGAGAATLLT